MTSEGNRKTNPETAIAGRKSLFSLKDTKRRTKTAPCRLPPDSSRLAEARAILG